MKLLATIISVLFALPLFSQLKARIYHDSLGTAEEYGFKSMVELPSGNMLYFTSADGKLGVVKTDSNFHVIESHFHWVGEGVYLIKSKLIGNNVYLYGEYGGYMPGGLQIALADTNGYMIRMAYFQDIIPDYNTCRSLDIFPIAEDYFGVVTGNSGLLEVVKIPSDLVIDAPVIAVDLFPDYYNLEYYVLLGVDASGDGHSFSFLAGNVDGAELHHIQFDFIQNFEIYENHYWKVPYGENVPPVDNFPPISAISREWGGSPVIVYENKVFATMVTNGPIPNWTSEILPPNYTILNFDLNVNDGLVLTAYNATDSLYYLGYRAIGDSVLSMYKNGLINKNTMENGMISGYLQGYNGETRTERFPIDEIATCREFKENITSTVSNFPLNYASDSIGVFFRLAQTYDYPPFYPYYTDVFYECDPNHLSIDENKIADINIFPNPATDVVHIETQETIGSVTVMDLSGKVIKIVDNNWPNISVEDLQSGMYILKIETKNGFILKKLMICR